jgi:hypothetical protein
MDAHLDADTLAAFAEHSQRGDERAAVFAHLSECETCREYLAVNAELKEFDWTADKPRHRIPGYVRTAAAILLLFFSAHPFRKVAMVVTPQHSRTPWEYVSLQKPSTPLRNIHGSFKEVTLATVSFSGDHASGGVDRITLKTALGERRITVEGFWEASRQ